MEIKKGILHRIIKEAGSDEIKTETRTECLNIDDRLIKLASDVLDIYGKQANSYGKFDEDTESYPFQTMLRELTRDDQPIDFVPFSSRALSQIVLRMKSSNFATGGYTVFLRYTNQQRDWLMVVMLKMKPGTGVDENTKSLISTASLDVEHLHEAARIDIAKWENSEEPYLSFVKKKAGGDDVSEYFRLALGCSEYINSKKNTEESIKALRAYARENNWSEEEKIEANRKFVDYFDERQKLGKNVNLTALSAIIDSENPESFRNYIRENDYKINDEFSPNKASFNKLRRITGKIGTISVSFDTNDLLTQKIDFNEVQNELVIKGLSLELIRKIKMAQGNDNPS